MTQSNLKFGIIGLGIGRNHLASLQEIDGIQIAAICDTNPDVLSRIQKQYDVPKSYTDGLKMLDKERFDAVVIATPNKFHAPFTIKAFERGAHVFCEKPMAMNTTEAIQMQAAADAAGKKLMLNMSFRYTPAAFALKKQLEQGMLGDIYFARTVWHRRRGIPKLGGWFSTKALSGGGPLIDLGVHRIDLALWFMGTPEPVSVSASVFNPIGTQLAKEQNRTFDVEDLAVAFIRLENGAILTAEASWAVNRAEREFMETRLYGTKAGAVHRNVDQGYDFIAEAFCEENGYFVDKIYRNEFRPAPKSIAHFIDCIRNDREPISSGKEGIKLMKILDGIYESARLGREISITA
ncbi:Gfo/Idh/MocA family oxidoreductase [candidate division KSB1 bacterium]|nr:Gfo/Idh/MocA family oxidoreductase [candidate division KSB1 bacterium]